MSNCVSRLLDPEVPASARPRPVRRPKVSRPPLRRQRHRRRYDPLLAALAAELGAALDEVRRLEPAYCDEEHFGVDWEEQTYEPALQRLQAAEKSLVGAMRQRGIPAVVVQGRLFTVLFDDDNQGLSNPCENIGVLSVRRIVRIV